MGNNWLHAVIVKFTLAVSLQHEVSWNLYLKNEGLSLRERSDFNRGFNPSQSVIKNEANTRQKKNVNAWIPL